MLAAYNLTRQVWLVEELEVANTFMTRLVGLMGRPSLPPRSGLWIKACDSVHTFAMRFPIDLVFLNKAHQVVRTVEAVRPYRVVFPVRKAVSVIELPAHSLRSSGTTPGDLLEFSPVPAEGLVSTGSLGKSGEATPADASPMEGSSNMTRERTAGSLRWIALLLLITATSGCQSWFGRGMRHVFLGRSSSSAEMAKSYRNVTPKLSITGGEPAPVPVTGGDLVTSVLGVSPVAVPDSDTPNPQVAVVANPNDPMARFSLGKVFLAQGQLEEATFQFDMASSLDPTFAESYFLLGRTLRLRRQFDLATAKLAAATRLDPRLTAAYIESGICWDERGFYGKAREQYLAALELSPSDPEIYNNIGYSYYLEGDVSAAIREYKEALQLDPSHARVNNNLAMAYALKHDYKKSLECFRRAHGEAIANNNVGYLLYREGKYKEAIGYYERALQVNPESQRALLNLENALRVTGRIEEALTIHQRFIQAQKIDVKSPFHPTPASVVTETK